MALGTNQQSGPSNLTKDFSATTPTAFERAVGHPTTLKALSAIERRADAVRQRAINHHKAFEDRWTAKEAIRLWERQLQSRNQHPAPSGARREVSPEEILKVASHNVRARTLRRLSKIKAIKTRMSNAIVRNLDTPRLRQDFQQAAPDRTNSPQPIQTMRRKQ